MLQQTQVKTVIPHFYKFTRKYPNIGSLAKAKEKNILKLWEGLGYYRRAKNLLITTKILSKFNYTLPTKIEEIQKLPGIGNYTANSLSALVHNYPTIAFDVNVKRVFSRIFNTEEKKLNFEQIKIFNSKKLFTHNRNGDFVEALMEFGSLICKAKDPNCNKCPLKINCKYDKSDEKIKEYRNFRIKLKKIDIFCFINDKKQIGLTKENNLGFLNNTALPKIKNRDISRKKNWKFLKNYNKYISNQKLNVNLYYKFSKKIPKKFKWYNLKENKEFVPSFTKNIISQIEGLC